MTLEPLSNNLVSKRCLHRCNSSGIVYTTAVEKTSDGNPGNAGSDVTHCSGLSSSLSAGDTSGGSGGSYTYSWVQVLVVAMCPIAASHNTTTYASLITDGNSCTLR